MPDDQEPNLPPLVVRVDADVPMVQLVEPPRPRPGLLGAALLTFGYWVVLIGGMLAVVGVALGWSLAFGDKRDLDTTSDGTHSVAKMPTAMRTALAWSLPAGYFFGLIYSLVVLRVVVGRRWIHDIGLTRLPPLHLLLGFLALPGFVILSDVLASALQPLDAFTHRVTGIPGLGDSNLALRALFENFHWSFAVFAIGLGPGVVEELWCRGFLGRGFIGRYGWLLGIGLASAFFGMLHLWPPSYVLVTAVMGACLHFAYVTSRSLWVPIAMHFTNNSFAALVSMGEVPSAGIEAAFAANPATITAVAASLTLFCALAMWQSRWTWPAERRGELLPPIQSPVELVAAKPSPFYPLAAGALCVALLWLLVA